MSIRRITQPSRCLFSGLLIAGLISLLGGPLCTAQPPAAPRRNVLLIVTDDMNDHLGCYGHTNVQSPAIDRLAARGMRFDRAYCQVPLCNPSRVSFLSGLRPEHTHVYTLRQPTRSHLGDWVMLPEHFKNEGYYTAQVGKIFHTGDGHEDPRSWDFMLREFGKRPAEDQILFGGEPPGPIKHTIDWSALKTPDAATPDGIVARKAAAMMKVLAGGGTPFFLGVGFRRPHAPFSAPKQYFDLYPPESISLPPEPPPQYFEHILPAAHNYAPAKTPMTELEHRQLIAAYYACNSFVDAQVGVLLTALDELELWDDTIVVFVSDHGYHLGDHGGLWHKCSLFEESAKVPLMVWSPGMRAAGKASRQLVELIDLYPTLTALAGISTPAGLDGRNMQPLLDAPAADYKDAAYSSIARGRDLSQRVDEIVYVGQSVRTARWRYTEWDDGKRGVELYDHENDSREWNNLADSPDHAETIARLSKILRDP